MFNPGPSTKWTKAYNNLSAKFARIKKKVWAEKKILQSRCSFFEKRPKTFFARFYFPENENLIFDAISNSGKRRVTPKLKFSLPLPKNSLGGPI